MLEGLAATGTEWRAAAESCGRVARRLKASEERPNRRAWLPARQACFEEQGEVNNFCSLLIGSFTEQAAISVPAIDAAGVDRRWLQWIQEGIYSEFLSLWVALYGREPILALRYEDLLAHPREQLSRVFNHVGLGTDRVDEAAWAAMEALVRRGKQKSAAEKEQGSGEAGRSLLGSGTYAQLSAFYAPFNARLAELTGDPSFMLWGNEAAAAAE